MNDGINLSLLVSAISIWVVLAYIIGYEKGGQDNKQEMCEVCEESCVD